MKSVLLHIYAHPVINMYSGNHNLIKHTSSIDVLFLFSQFQLLLTELSFRKQKETDDKRIEEIKAEIRRLKEEKEDNDEK